MIYLRSLLFVPGNQPSMLSKAAGLRPDAFVPDMEDSVAWDDKDEARQVVADHIETLNQSGKPVIPRLNSLDTGLFQKDLEAVAQTGIYGISVGKINSEKDVGLISEAIKEQESKYGIEHGSIKLIPWIETAKGLLRCYEILTSDRRIIAAAFGAEDFTNDMGIERRADNSETIYARNQVTVSARAANVLSLDTPYFGFRDSEGLKVSAQDAKSIGFKGKFAIHPSQIQHINKCFSPSDSEIEHAKSIIKIFEESKAKGRGSTSLNGQVVDVPVVKRAEALLAQAEEIPAE